ncbi:Hypothetical protein, putative [Bodo saltans]|uniref:Uncharacterized protein n=1 Tax=Bodo saltans TaxID=75058 RepID=A0A0S4IZX1_BODSA|nr:Hypothetical protein, putative [Bodo saltans]|eukprot:CUG71420.1 Hypothetical protein, putative [Bodo saltans]
MPPPLRTGARKANPFDDQLAALRQRIAQGSCNDLVSAAFSMLAVSPHPHRHQKFSSHQTVDGTTASMLETLRYLKRAAKDRMEEFTDMNEQFCYNAEEEEASFIKKQIATSNGQPIVKHYHDPLQDPFVFDEVDEPHAVVAPSTFSRLSTSPAPAMTTATPLERRDSSQPRGAASRTFEASYDVSSALVTPSSRRSAQQPALGRMDSATGTTKQNTSASSSIVGQSMFSSQITTIKGTATHHHNSTQFATTGTVVAHSSVSVASHIRQGAARLVATEHVSAHTPLGARKQIQRHRPSCTVEMMEPTGIHFCEHCGHCMLVIGNPTEGNACTGCGQVMHTNTRRIHNASSEDNEAALRHIEEMERIEALAFQAAIAEWRGEQETSHVAPEENSARTIAAPGKVGSLHLVVPSGKTYFSHLWEQLQQVVL